MTAFYSVGLILVVFVVPETNYSRPLRYETDIAPEIADKDLESSDGGSQTEKTATVATDVESANEENEKPLSYWQQLLPCRDFKYVNPLPLFLRYFACIFYPIVWFAFLVSPPLSSVQKRG